MNHHSKALSAGSTHRPSGRVGLAVFSAVAALLIAAALLVGSPARGVAAGCPNEAIRAEQGEAGLALPGCRAYEMVSPLGSIPKASQFRVASPEGTRYLYSSNYPYPGEENGGLFYVSERTSEGWRTHTPIPPDSGASSADAFACVPTFLGVSDLSSVLLMLGFQETELVHSGEGNECNGPEPPLDPDAPRGYTNIYRSDPTGDTYDLVNRPPAGVEVENALVEASNSDASVVVFSEKAQLTPDAPAAPSGLNTGSKISDLYVWSEGTIRYVPYLPDGTPVLAHLANGGTDGGLNLATQTHAVSEDGERIFFLYESKIYLREHALREQSAISGGECTEPAKACTIPIDVSEEGPSEMGDQFDERAAYDREFLYATPDGSRAFFTDRRRLTPDSTAVLPDRKQGISAKSDLYEYDVGTGETTDLTVNVGEPAEVRGLAGASEDGSYLYFVATGNLTGTQENSAGATAASRSKGSGATIGPVNATGELTAGSTQITSVSVEVISEGPTKNNRIHIGQELKGGMFELEGKEEEAIEAGTKVVACSPSCSSPTELTMSRPATETLSSTDFTALGEFEVTGVTTTSGEFKVGMRVFIGSDFDRQEAEITAVSPGDLTLSARAEASKTAPLEASAPNLYLLHNGSTTYIATLAGLGEERRAWQESQGGQPNMGDLSSYTTTSGKFIGFPSILSLTGFDNTVDKPCTVFELDEETHNCMELFLYDAERNQLSCPSCSPSGEVPIKPIDIAEVGTIAATYSRHTGSVPQYITRSISESGAVFFQTPNPLLPDDENEASDVYEYDEDGELHLISTGKGLGDATFAGASADGSNVFFIGGQSLVNGDTDGSSSLYVARVNGGFPEPPPLPGCEVEACRGAATGPVPSGRAGTSVFRGPGNTQAPHLQDCSLFSERASKLSQSAKSLRRQAAKSGGRRAAQLRSRAGKLAAKGHKLSKKAKACRRDNRGTAK